MGEIIIHHKGKYNIWSTVVDAPLCAEAVTLKELTAWVEGRHGASGLRELPRRNALRGFDAGKRGSMKAIIRGTQEVELKPCTSR